MNSDIANCNTIFMSTYFKQNLDSYYVLIQLCDLMCLCNFLLAPINI